MSYHRDHDGHTRGVGAIAAIDGPRRTRKRQRLAQVLAQKDQRRAKLTMDNAGRVQALGAVSRTGSSFQNKNAPILGGGGQTFDSSGGVRGTLPQTYTPGGTGGGAGGMKPRPSTLLIPATVAPSGGGGGGAGGTRGGSGGSSSGGGGGTVIVSDPVPGTSPPDISLPGAPTSGSSGSGGGSVDGGGAGVQSGGSSTPPTFIDPGVVPSEEPDVGMSNGMKLALGAAAIGGLWYLFGRKKTGGSSP